MKETPVQLLKRILEGQKDEPFDYDEWCISLEYAEDTEKEQMEEIREMLVQGALTNMSCASAVVEFDKLTKSE